MCLAIVGLFKRGPQTEVHIQTPLQGRDIITLDHSYEKIIASIKQVRAGMPVDEAFDYLTEEEYCLIAHGERQVLLRTASV